MFEANTGIWESFQCFLHTFANGEFVALDVYLDEGNVLKIAATYKRVEGSDGNGGYFRLIRAGAAESLCDHTMIGGMLLVVPKLYFAIGTAHCGVDCFDRGGEILATNDFLQECECLAIGFERVNFRTWFQRAGEDCGCVDPPRSRMGPTDDVDAAAKASPLYAKYGTRVDNQSARELLAARMAPPPAASAAPAETPKPTEPQKAAAAAAGGGLAAVTDFLKSRQGQKIEGQVVRGIFGMLKK